MSGERAEPLTPGEEAALRDRAKDNGRFVAGDGDVGVSLFSGRDINALLATLDAERAARDECERQLQDWIARYNALHSELDAERAARDGDWLREAAAPCPHGIGGGLLPFCGDCRAALAAPVPALGREALWAKLTAGEKLAYGCGYRDGRGAAATQREPNP